MEITPISIIIWISAILIVSLDIVIIIGSKNLSSRLFALLTLITAIWVITQGILISSIDITLSIALLRLQYILGITIAIGFLHFSYVYPHDIKPSKKSLAISTSILLIFTYLYLFTNTLLVDAYRIQSLGNWAWTFGPYSIIFDLIFCILWITSLVRIYQTYVKTTGEIHKNLKNMFFTLFLGIIPPTLANIVLPSIGVFSFNWTGPIMSTVWIFIIGYSIAKYRQMGVKVAITKVFVIAMVMMALLNIFVDLIFGIYSRIALFIAFAILGYFLFKSLTKESSQRELLTSLNSTLSEKVAEQTTEIRKAYELEKHARRELEKLNETKDQFIMITQHHLRSPVTNIRSELEAMQNGTYGKLDAGQSQAITKTNASVSRLTRIVDDFLNISTLKVGSQILDIKTGNMKPILIEVLDELRIDIERSHLSVKYPESTADWPHIEIDASKMHEALLIVIDNAVKYNVDGGSIVISTRTEDNSVENHTDNSRVFEMIIENTGIGLIAEDREKLFTRHFYRSKRAQSANPIGMGIGLSVARAVVRAHHGTLEIESDGEGKGARVRFRLPRFAQQLTIV